MKLKIRESKLEEASFKDFIKGLASTFKPAGNISNFISTLTGKGNNGEAGDTFNTSQQELKGTDSEFQELVQALIDDKTRFSIQTNPSTKSIDVSFSATSVPNTVAQELDPNGEDNLYTKFYKDYNTQNKTITLSAPTNFVETGLVNSNEYVNQSLTAEQQEAIDAVLKDNNLNYVKELVKKENPGIDDTTLAIEIGKKLQSLPSDENYEMISDMVKSTNPTLTDNAELGYGIAQLLNKLNQQGMISEAVKVKEGNPFKSHHICKGCGNTLDKCTCSIEELDEDFGGMATQPSSIGQHHIDSIDLGFCDNNDEQVLYMDYTVKKSKKFPKEYEIYLGEDLIYSDEGSIEEGTNYIKKYLS